MTRIVIVGGVDVVPLAATIDERLRAIDAELLGSGITLRQAMSVFEARYIAGAMQICGNVTQASRRLGVHRNTLHNKLHHRTRPIIEPTPEMSRRSRRRNRNRRR